MTERRALVVGSTGGIGRALVDALVHSGSHDCIYAASRDGSASGQNGVEPLLIDILCEASLAAAATEVARAGPLDLLLVATGLLHRGAGLQPEKSARALNAQVMAEMFAVNSIGPALVAKHFLPLLPSRGRAVMAFLSARVGSIEDNRLGGWHSYRASKAALNAFIRCFAIEAQRRNPEALVVALHPGTVDTRLSSPFQRNVRAGSLFTPAISASNLLEVIGRLTPADSGGFFGWDGSRISF
ncbi:SDR family NAD(P)-dependent oxidoreductase [Sphingopyxis sp. KK2]|uniref:SDR family NAD(P)-dependent oxidoreductase n=1 Tax=Sphingopyxis sp. KK2 TaxID=1855727 RepID=UPI00097E6B5D|nr:SDR family NAD(P)-dependent oxidoreductase [Sphingopyxis sp. KK2]